MSKNKMKMLGDPSRRHILNAASHGNLDMVKKLLKDDADCVHYGDWFGTPLHRVLKCRNNLKKCLKICELLLQHGADVKRVDSSGRTPLHYVSTFTKHNSENCSTLAVQIADMLISRGADVNVQDKKSITPLMLAVESQSTGIAERLLLSGANPNEVNKDKSLLTQAIANGNEKMVRLLLRYKVDVNDANAMQTCVCMNRVRCFQLLLNCGADLGNIDCKRHQAGREFEVLLATVIFHGYAEMLDFLLGIRSYLDMAVYFRVILLHFTVWPNEHSATKYIETRNVIFKHIAFMNELEQKALEKSLERFVEARGSLDNVYKKYTHELVTMRQTKICEDLNLTYFDLLTEKGRSLPRYCSDKIIAAISASDKIDAFRYYRKKLKKNLEIGQLNRKIRDEFQNMLHELLGQRLCFDLIISICDFLTIADLYPFAIFEQDLDLI